MNCGFRQVVNVLEIINEEFSNVFDEIPCHNTIENWVKKCGLDLYKTSGDKLKDSKYAQIVDESMMIGNEKLLLTLGVPAEHVGRPLNFNDVKILDMAVANSWNGEGVSRQLETAARKVGHDPEYVISDNASVMNKGIRCANFKHQHDISHSLGMFLERTYKNDLEFIDYCKLMTAPKFKYNMTKIAYLLPPKQRTVARFMNMKDWVVWSFKILKAYNGLSDEERKIFSFVPAKAPFIDELMKVQRCINKIEKMCKDKGLSKETGMKCRQEVMDCLLKGNQRMKSLGVQICDFLTKEVEAVEEGAIHNNSSDIIESIFGKYKTRKSPNKLNGVTPFILFLPLHAALSGKTKKEKYDFKSALENTLVKDINVWADKNLTPNLIQSRINKLNKAA